MFLHNYHTHTVRCQHAEGTDREYVEAAIQAGFKTLGFSDHAPYVSPIGNTGPQMRMHLEQAEDYVQSIRALAKEYANDIRILCGVELEYYPHFHRDEMAFLRMLSIDYCILGQHFMYNQLPPIASSSLTEDEQLHAYISQVIAGLATGDFLYLAHPDMVGYRFSQQAIDTEYRRLCEAAKAYNIPLEINLLGLRQHRHYPDDRLFRIAADVGNEIVFGVDAHTPQSLIQSGEKEGNEMVKRLGLQLVTRPLL